MPRTIGKHRPRDLPPGDFECICDYCGVVWYRSQLRRDDSGFLFCPDEGDGLDAVALNMANAASQTTWHRTGNDQPADAKNTDVAPNMATLLEAPTGGNSA